ncbi:RagB/SusD family nutrient uptake outer membrane protein [Puia dinghuensis]|uniref:RagB/SusD family nutrient uptake outer membrane protein n=1 Tax=Puia dinghuensis TaxID=1792502 RepID=A0A8J2XW49_9BACT|nr:RagB/SusD family nutrient uptake outer membrane protein [Puia dinghuensis]GGB23620.1 hypothetical protein GCM10011511_54350 [Puia dinghuensis]
MSMPFVIRGGLFFLLFSLCCASCHKWLQVSPPENQLGTATVFANDANAENALLGMYIQMMNNSRALLNGGMSLYGGLSSDDLGCNGHNLQEYGFFRDTLSAGNSLCAGLYDTGYHLIYIANSLLQGVQQATQVTAATRAQLSGEAKFARAFLYFYLVNLYGAVPLVLSTDYTHTATLPRSPVAAVYAQIVADLQDAQQLLSVDYPQTGASPADRTRPNRAAATALLARVRLYTGDWIKADSAATAVISNPAYRLEMSLDSVFRGTSHEAIWQLQPVHGNNATAEGSFFIPAAMNAPPTYPLTPSLLNSFEAGDQRRTHWTARSANGQTFPYKYKQRVSDPANPEYNMVIRLSECYLIRAEARAMQGDTAGALADVNSIRQRAGLSPFGPLTTDDNLAAIILHERQTELFAEWGHRWLDLKRTGQADGILGADAQKPLWRSTDVLYPLPAGELSANPSLWQNPGY